MFAIKTPNGFINADRFDTRAEAICDDLNSDDFFGSHKVFANQLPRVRHTSSNPRNGAVAHVRKIMRESSCSLASAIEQVSKARNLPPTWVRQDYDADEVMRSWDE